MILLSLSAAVLAACRPSVLPQTEPGPRCRTELFNQETLDRNAKKPELAKVHCGRNEECLMDKYNLDISAAGRLGSHSALQTHRKKERVPGILGRTGPAIEAGRLLVN